MSVKRIGVWVTAWLLSVISLAGAADAPLADAAEIMDRESIRALLREPVDVNLAQVDGMTALHWAARHDDLEIAKLLVRAEADVNAANRYGVTPLTLACTNGNGALVELLLEAGADPNSTLPGGGSQSMQVSGLMYNRSSASWNASTGHTAAQSVYLQSTHGAVTM